MPLASSKTLTLLALGSMLFLAAASDAQPKPIVFPARGEDPLVEVAHACPGVVVELRYAGANNVTGHPIYPQGARAFLRRSVAERLSRAQQLLQDRGFNLKIWDAYRPAWVQRVLWNAIRNPAYVVEPSSTGSLHGWGAAVDVTLVDAHGHDAKMPTDFDSFSEAARYDYKGPDAEIAFNLSQLKRAMADAGFRHIRDEWWHYSLNLPGGGPIDAPLVPNEPAPEVAQASPAPPPPPSPPKPAKIYRTAATGVSRKIARKKPREEHPLFRVNVPDVL